MAPSCNMYLVKDIQDSSSTDFFGFDSPESLGKTGDSIAELPADISEKASEDFRGAESW